MANEGIERVNSETGEYIQPYNGEINNMKNRFDLEEAITNVFDVNDELELLLYRIGDSPVTPSEDDLMNMLIGIIELNKVRYEKLWNTFSSLISNEVITSKNIEE